VVAGGAGIMDGGGMAAAMAAGTMRMLIVLADLKAARQRIQVTAGMAAEEDIRVAEAGEGNEPHNSLHNRPNNFMKFSNQFTRFIGLLTAALLTGACGIFSLHATDPNEASPNPVQQLFASPAEAVKALQAATQAKDTAALNEIFGPENKELLTGDKVQDANNAHRFATAMALSCNLVPEGDGKITLEVGTNDWPMPIPLVETNGQWFFDTVAGKEEIINRHVGKDELCAIGVCRAYVTAQRQYASMNGGVYALKFKSTPGKKDGLYWFETENEPASPFGPLVAEAHVEGYHHHDGVGPQPFHGYYFRILTRQGDAAPGGKMNYLSIGNLTEGFALVAYPENWDQSGIMTFIVNQDGKVYQQNLGEKTSRIAGEMKAYNPDSEWSLVQDEGVLGAVLEK
jgi:hypothetical protein